MSPITSTLYIEHFENSQKDKEFDEKHSYVYANSLDYYNEGNMRKKREKQFANDVMP